MTYTNWIKTNIVNFYTVFLVRNPVHLSMVKLQEASLKTRSLLEKVYGSLLECLSASEAATL